MDSYMESNPETTGLSAHLGLPSPPPDETNDSSTPTEDHPAKRLVSLDNLRIAKSQIRRLDGASEVISGGYGDVELAILDAGPPDGSRPASEDVEHVAVKKIRYGTDDDDDRVLARFTREIKLINDLDDENIVKLIGFVEHFDEGVLWMVFPWEKNGNLREFVRSANWELPERISLIDDVARGVAYLHSRQPPICHGDLKSLNVLINDEHRAIITDFGSARAVDIPHQRAKSSAKATPRNNLQLQEAIDSSLKAELSATKDSILMTGPGWTMRWAAPELLLDTGTAGLASDVWALGWIFWEGITGTFPFNNEDKDGQVILRITSGDLPKLGTNIQFAQVQALCTLMMECWSLEVDERPSALECQQRLNWMEMVVPSRNVGTRSVRLLLALGRIHGGNGGLEEQLNYTKTALEIARETQNADDEAEALKDLGTVGYLGSRYSEAEKAYTEARDIFSRIEDQLGLAECVFRLGEVHRMRNKYTEAEEAYTEARDIFSQLGHQFGFAQCVKSLGEVHQVSSNYSEAEKAYIEARDIFSQIGHQLGFAQCVKGLGEVRRVSSEYTEAEKAYTEARDIFSRIGDQLGLAQCVKSLGHVHQRRNAYTEAEKAYTEARDIFFRIGDQLGLAQCVQSVGEVHQMRNEYNEAEKAYIEAREIFSRIGNQLGFAQCVKSLGHVHQMRNEDNEAEKAYIEAREIFSRIGDQLGLAQCVKSLGYVHQMRNEYNEAQKACIEAREIFSRIGDQLGLAQCVQDLGEVHEMRAEYTEAEKTYMEACEIFSRIGSQLGLAQCVQGLGAVHQMRYEYNEAEKAYTEARDIFSQIGDQPGFAQCVESLGEIKQMLN